MELNEKWKLTTQNNAYLWEGNQFSKQNRYPCLNTPQKVQLFLSPTWETILSMVQPYRSS